MIKHPQAHLTRSIPPTTILEKMRSAESVEELWKHFLQERKPTTQQTYTKSFEKLRQHLGKASISETLQYLASLDAANANLLALEWKNALDSANHAPATVNLHLSTLKSAVRFLRMIGAVSWTIEIRNKKAETYRDTRGPSLDTIKQAIAYLRSPQASKIGEDWQIMQLETLVVLLFSLGLRRGEVIALTVDDIDNGTSAVWITGKGRDARERLDLPPNAQKALLRWLSERTRLLTLTPHPNALKSLFLNRDGHPLNAAALYHQIAQLGKQIGATLRPHGLRHAAITQAFERAKTDPSVGLAQIQRFSRHAKADTLLIYKDNHDNEALRVASSLDNLLD